MWQHTALPAVTIIFINFVQVAIGGVIPPGGAPGTGAINQCCECSMSHALVTKGQYNALVDVRSCGDDELCVRNETYVDDVIHSSCTGGGMVYVHGNNLIPKPRCALGGAKSVFSVGRGLDNVSESYREAPGGSSGGFWVDCEPAVELAPVSERPFYFADTPAAGRVKIPPFAFPQLPASIGPSGGAERMFRHQLRDLPADCEDDGCLEPWKFNCTECNPDRDPIFSSGGIIIPDVAQGECTYRYHGQVGGGAVHRPPSYYGLSFDSNTGKTTGTSLAASTRIMYHAPEISNVTYGGVEELPTVGGPEITLIGQWFGRGPISNVQVSVGGGDPTKRRTCTVLKRTETSIVCRAPPGQGTAASENFIRIQLLGSWYCRSIQPYGIAYVAPNISRIDPALGAPTVGGAVTLYGSNFGDDVSKIVVVVKGMGRFPVTSRSPLHDSLTFTMPEGQGAGLVLVVESADLRSGPAVFQYKRPTMTRIEPSSLPTSGGSLTIYGSDFGPDLARTFVTIGGLLSCTPTQVAADHASLQCTLEAGTGSGLPVALSSAGQSAESLGASLRFSFQPPVVTSCSPAMISTEGGFVECDGTNFGPNVSAISATIRGGQSCTVDALVRLHDKIRLKVPGGTGANQTIRVLVADQADTTLVSYLPPTVEGLSWTSPASTSGGAVLEITGQNLGNDLNVVRVLVGSISCAVTALVGHRRLYCKIAAGFGADLPLKVCVDSQCVEGGKHHLFSYDPPQVDAVSLLQEQNTTASTQGGFTVVLEGRNFGALNSGSTSLMRVYVYSPPFAEMPCSNLTMMRAHSELWCIAPRGQGRDKRVRLETLASTSSASSRQHSFLSLSGFSYARPRLFLSHTPQLQLGPTSGGGSVVIRGEHFGSSASLVVVRVGAGGCSNVGLHNDSHISCTAEPGQGHSHRVGVTVSGQSTAADNFLLLASYDAPEILTMAPRSLGPGQTLSLSGLNFGLPSRQHEISVLLGAGKDAIACGNVRVVEAHHRIECTLPQNMTRKMNVELNLVVSGLAAVPSGGGGNTTVSIITGCRPGEYLQSEDEECRPCPSPLHASPGGFASAASCTCRPGSFGPPGGDCYPCPSEFAKCGGASILIPQGFALLRDTQEDSTNTTAGNVTIKKCWKGKAACNPQSFTVSSDRLGTLSFHETTNASLCSEGFEGPLCSRCAQGHYAVQNLCRQCGQSLSWQIPLYSLALVAFCVGLFLLPIERHRADLWPISRAAIIVYTLQFLSAMGNISVDWPEQFSSTAAGISALQINPELVGPECWFRKGCSYRCKTIVFLVFPLVIVALVWALKALLSLIVWTFFHFDLHFASTRTLTTYLHESNARCVRATCVVLLCAYLLLSERMFQGFNCIELDGEERLVSRLDIRCYSMEHPLDLLYLGIIIYPLGLFVLLCFVLWTIRNQLDDTWIRSCFGPLYHYHPKFWYFEIVRSFFRVLSVAIIALNEPYAFNTMQLMLLLLLVELFLVLILSPHPKWEDNALMTISLVVLVVHSYSGAIYSVAPNLPERYRRTLEVIDLLSIVLYCCGAAAMAAISLYSTGYVKADMVERASSMVEGASKSVVKSLKSFRSFHSSRALAALTSIGGTSSRSNSDSSRGSRKSSKRSKRSTSSLEEVAEVDENIWEENEDGEEKHEAATTKRERYKGRKRREKEARSAERSVKEIELNPLHRDSAELNGRDLFISQPSAASWNVYNRAAENGSKLGPGKSASPRERRRGRSEDL